MKRAKNSSRKALRFTRRREVAWRFGFKRHPILATYIEDMKRQRTPRKARKTPAFVLRGERAARRAARNVRKQNRALGLPLIVWENGKVVEKPA